MAYTRPMVMVFQEYADTSTTTPSASLPPCIIGPCYHIVDAVEDEGNSLYGHYTEAGIENGFFPNNAPGALIDEKSVSFRLKNARVRLYADLAAGARSTGNCLLFDEGYPKGILVGDIVRLTDTTAPDTPKEIGTEYRVTTVDDIAKALFLNRTLPEGKTLAVEILRIVEDVILPAGSDGILLDVTSERFSMVGVTTPVEGLEDAPKACRISSAELYVGYRALRQDLSDILTLYSVDEISGKLGKIVPENPLAFGVSIAMANAAVGIKCVGVDSEDLAGYTAAKDRLETHDPVYALVPLTFDPAVLSMFKLHAEQMSQPERGMWRIALGCTRLVTEKEIASGTGKVGKDGDGDLVRLLSPEAAFLSGSVDAGDTLVMTDGDGAEHEYTVSSVVAEDLLTVTQSAPFDGEFFTEAGEYRFRVLHRLDKLDQAKEIAATSRAYGSSRFINIWPDICVVGGRELPGYYLACAVAGGIGGLPSHYGFTRLSIAGIDGLKNSNSRFNNDQLDVMADGGTFIFVQASSSAPPHIRHQLTTDRSTLEMQELSFVKNFDYVSYICRDTMNAFIGRYNITQSTLATLRTALRGALETLRLDTSPKIGSRVLDYTITSVAQMEDVRDRVEMVAEVAFPYPLNTIGLHLTAVHMRVASN